MGLVPGGAQTGRKAQVNQNWLWRKWVVGGLKRELGRKKKSCSNRKPEKSRKSA